MNDIHDALFNHKSREILRQAIQYFGSIPQMHKTIEELTELSAALTFFLKTNFQCRMREEVIDEIADVIIMCMQSSMIMGEKDVADRIEFKLNRLKKNIVLKMESDEENK